ncbi:DNA methyltransferase [Limnoglobus roseus]|uniref:Methyltransferase n=1 Tax=Limnoglobus roseus TaxID=2598579 RepID=A0A5C1AQH2_9BACT|nr:DNA methyltransferase [Limnoglobus roseus]QEL20437.1 site-specific DNA-methyltransferase [Limnoglobus roseus]
MPSKKSLTAKPARNLFSSTLDAQSIFLGDNLDVLKGIPNKSVDLIYIDPPFNSDRNYEVFWGDKKELRTFDDRHGSTGAYIDFMRPRCLELARVLKPTGSFYYHCDWHASHYVKVMLDQIFGENNFQNEIVWKRFSAKNDAVRYGRGHDAIFFYTGSKAYTWNPKYGPFEPDYVEQNYRYTEEGTGRRYRLSDLTANKGGGDVDYEWHGMLPYKGRHWAYSREKMDQFLEEGRIVFRKTGMPVYKRYLDEMPGVPLQDVWTDIRLHAGAKERIGWPTQKPLPLLKRIIEASSNPDDIVLDAFCGCGTALVAAQNLGRRWIGIDVSPTACRVMADRLTSVCHLKEDRDFRVIGMEFDPVALRRMPPFEFENWAVISLGGVPNRAKVGDKGIDGRIYPTHALPKKAKKPRQMTIFDNWYPIQVKQTDKIGRPDVDQFEAVMVRENRPKGFMVGFEYTSDARREIDRFLRSAKRAIIPVTVEQILDADPELARKLV